MKSPKTIKYSPEQYQKLILETVKKKSRGLIVGSVVLVLLISSVLYNKSRLEEKFNDISFQAPPPAAINIDRVMDKTKRVDLKSQILPSNTPQIPVTKENEASLGTGEITGIMSSRATNIGSSYTVQEGDSLASIAEKAYGDSNAWVMIAEANNLESPDQIEIGMVLKIPRR